LAKNTAGGVAIQAEANSTTTTPHMSLVENDNDYARLNYSRAGQSGFWATAGYVSSDPSFSRYNIFYSPTANDIMTVWGDNRVTVTGELSATQSTDGRSAIRGNAGFGGVAVYASNPDPDFTSYAIYAQGQTQLNGDLDVTGKVILAGPQRFTATSGTGLPIRVVLMGFDSIGDSIAYCADNEIPISGGCQTQDQDDIEISVMVGAAASNPLTTGSAPQLGGGWRCRADTGDPFDSTFPIRAQAICLRVCQTAPCTYP
jgi:hypothetical protein